MKKLIISLLFIPFLSGCAAVNFSSKYYTPPDNYEQEIAKIWNEMITKVPLKHKDYYTYRIVKDNQTKPSGIPQSVSKGSSCTILIPEYFIKYVWEFYYPNYHQEIIGCLFSHELGHPESNYSSATPQQHVLCDEYTIKNLLLPTSTFNTYYSTLIVVRDYWLARKGVGGHVFNIGWNALNITSLIFFGAGQVGDLYATDLNYRISKLRKSHRSLPCKFIFKRSKHITEQN